MTTLTEKKCEPCEGGIPPLSAEQVDFYAKELGDRAWEIVDNKKIKKEWKFDDFKEAMRFIEKVAEIANEEGHHPDIWISYNIVRLELWTHAIGGLSENDFILAAKINRI